MPQGKDLPFDPSEQELDALRSKLIGAVNKICPFWLRDVREDIVQVGLLRVIEIQHRSEEKRVFSSSYLWMTAYSAVIDEIRRHRRRREVSLTEGATDKAASQHPSPERTAASEEVGQGILDCLRRLVLPRRLAVALYLRGHSARQAAECLGWREKKTQNLIFRGREDLRRCLREKGYEL